MYKAMWSEEVWHFVELPLPILYSLCEYIEYFELEILDFDVDQLMK